MKYRCCATKRQSRYSPEGTTSNSSAGQTKCSFVRRIDNVKRSRCRPSFAQEINEPAIRGKLRLGKARQNVFHFAAVLRIDQNYRLLPIGSNLPKLGRVSVTQTGGDFFAGNSANEDNPLSVRRQNRLRIASRSCQCFGFSAV